MIVGKDGNAWYSNFGEQTFGNIDPKTGKHTEYPVPELKKGWPTGMLGLRPDKDGNMWLGMMYQGAIAKFDLKDREVHHLEPASGDEQGHDPGQHGAGRVRARRRQGVVAEQRLRRHPPARPQDRRRSSPSSRSRTPAVGENHNIYDIIPDSQNNAYFTDFAQQHIGRIDAKTGKVTLYQVPTRSSAPRRGMMDAQDRIWFGEYRGNRIGMFDTKTETVHRNGTRRRRGRRPTTSPSTRTAKPGPAR